MRRPHLRRKTQCRTVQLGTLAAGAATGSNQPHAGEAGGGETS
jgi:hypothetical protein